MLQEAVDLYADISNIGHAIAASKGEWAFGLSNTDIAKLISAFALRIPPKPRYLQGLNLGQSNQQTKEVAMLQRLEAFGISLDTEKLGGYDECDNIPFQSDETCDSYMKVLRNSRVSLFIKAEFLSRREREKFLKRVRTAAKHLLDTYFPEIHGASHQALCILNHPSIGMKDFAEKVYEALQINWRCQCQQRTTSTKAREVRLSLTQHRLPGPRIPAELKSTIHQLPAKFEVQLPVCKDKFDWKVTTIEVKNAKDRATANISGELLKNDLCHYLRRSDTVQVEFLIDSGTMWHLNPKLLVEDNDQTSIRTLRQLLSDNRSRSFFADCSPKEQLSLCYVLANSMLYIYPSSWLENDWNSDMVYFSQHSETSSQPILTSPYILTDLRPIGEPKQPFDRMQDHRHPAILALGIVFLEIATGNRFSRTNSGALGAAEQRQYPSNRDVGDIREEGSA
ncbi:hypothetical protein FB567DRAFT_275076 [Paraphoma chrysanthemicola]|uniref:DUF7580 domain-containing protein n=1 Tax=Paraphoma chrysanthemicola TaxID=798071 RepID=A0A8K0W2P7_9PLEO|nr:hypothetical protein FB567DRAFT_275076 [Paraphoma chrysanthemicola]